MRPSLAKALCSGSGRYLVGPVSCTAVHWAVQGSSSRWLHPHTSGGRRGEGGGAATMEEGGANLAMEEPSEKHFIGFDFSTQQVRGGVSQSDSD